MQPAAAAGLLGSVSLLTATYCNFCVELNERCDSVRVSVPDEATVATTIQDEQLQG